MAASKTAPKWSDGPFDLLSSTRYTNKGTYDIFNQCASEMAMVHNSMIRGLNSIYLQAPHVLPADYKDFIEYSRCWAELVTEHHSGEEVVFFPNIEKATGETGLMAANVEQHHVFHEGLLNFTAYLDTCAASPSTFSGTHLISIIDTFASTLVGHMHDEIPTLLLLSKHSSTLDLAAEWKRAEAHAIKHVDPWRSHIFFVRNHDVTFEEGLWKNFPEGMPTVVKWLHWWIWPLRHRGYWRFASCNRYGVPRKLFAGPKE